ncbi:MAG TPA: HDOD domain-containing protein [Candidatus Hydrogenedentes bacterium]|mgnify:CR=1 FL=1|nr:HDOD domain-containing protein [Candidatus Hydrogenedentota bacterium]
MKTMTIEEAIPKIRELPTLPQIVLRIMDTINNPNSSAVDLGELVATDQSLSATLLRVVNSAYYGFSRRVTSISQAIVLLGFAEVRKLALAAKTFEALGLGGNMERRQRLWRHAFATAMAAEMIGKQGAGRNMGFFEAGLLHDIGRVAMELLFGEAFETSVTLLRERGAVDICAVEREVFGFDHAQFGGALAEHWSLPPALREAIQRHHAPGLARLEPGLAHLTALANWLANCAGFSEIAADEQVARAPLLDSLQTLRVPEETVQALLQLLRDSTARLDALLASVAGNG